MKRICNQCQTEMVEECEIVLQGQPLHGIKVKKVGTGVFNSISDKVKAAVCPNCGYVMLYIDNYQDYPLIK